MSKIEEMATKYANETDIPGTRAIWKRGFADGAKAVLEEIEKYISELPCKSDGELVNQKMLWQRVKQLKG